MAIREMVANAEAGAKTLPIQQRRKIMLITFAVIAVLLMASLGLYLYWRDVSLSVSDKQLCSEMMNKGFQVASGGSQGGCQLTNVNVDFISALNPFASNYKASQGPRDFDIKKNLVSIEH